ncbi:hypothetical protein EDD16DRAFT_84113 [Pisolithus croceorrhizus]|nr:hypothetical protein EDD16DRAFT_84113 [Pisolithus croceorrhizus]
MLSFLLLGSRFLSLILAPNRSIRPRNSCVPSQPLPPPGWALIATRRQSVPDGTSARHLHEHLPHASWQPTASFRAVLALPAPPTNYVLLGCRHGHAHGISQHGREPVSVSRHEHEPFRQYEHEPEHGPLQYAHEPRQLYPQSRLLGHAQCPAELKLHERNDGQISLSILFQSVPATRPTIYGSATLTNAQHGFAVAFFSQSEQHCCYSKCRSVHIADAAHVCLAIAVSCPARPHNNSNPHSHPLNLTPAQLLNNNSLARSIPHLLQVALAT